MAVFVFGVPLKGSLAALAVGALLYVTATTGYGLLISAFASTQIAALFGTAILTVLPATQFSGMLTPVSALSGLAGADGPAVPDDLFPADQRRHLHQVPRLRRPRAAPWSALALFVPALTGPQPAAAAQAGAVRRMRRASPTSSGSATKELRSFLHDFVLLGLVIYSFSFADLRAVAEHLAGAAQRGDRHRRRGPLGAVARGSRRRSCRPTSSRRCRSRRAMSTACMDTARYTFVLDIPPHFAARRAGGAQAGDPGQRRCDGGDAGGRRRRLHPADRDHRERHATSARADAAPPAPVDARRAHRLQPERHRRRGSPASWASSTTSRCWRSSSPAPR